MIPLPAVPPATGLSQRIRLARDYYVRVDTCDYSVDPRFIGRHIDVAASPEAVTVSCGGQPAASHPRSWAKHAVITDPAHQAAAAAMRQALAADRAARERARRHSDGTAVMLRALPGYDALFGVDFTPPAPPAEAN